MIPQATQLVPRLPVQYYQGTGQQERMRLGTFDRQCRSAAGRQSFRLPPFITIFKADDIRPSDLRCCICTVCAKPVLFFLKVTGPVVATRKRFLIVSYGDSKFRKVNLKWEIPKGASSISFKRDTEMLAILATRRFLM